MLAALCPWVTSDNVNVHSTEYGWCLLSCTVTNLDLVFFQVPLVGAHSLPSTQELPHLGKNPQNLSTNPHKLCLATLHTEAVRQEALQWAEDY